MEFIKYSVDYTYIIQLRLMRKWARLDCLNAA